jgi:ankyrin repeat protein
VQIHFEFFFVVKEVPFGWLQNEKTPLHVSAQRGNLDAVEFLLSINCDPGMKDKVRQRSCMCSLSSLLCLKQAGQTPIHLAAAGGHVDVLKKLLLVGVEVNDKDNVNNETQKVESRFNVLFCAGRKGEQRFISQLKEATLRLQRRCLLAPLIPTQKQRLMKHTPCLHVCKSPLLQKAMTPLHIAATSGHVDFMNCLFENRCNINALNHVMSVT